MNELKEQCEERIDELTKKVTDVPQIKENKDLSEDLKKTSQVWLGNFLKIVSFVIRGQLCTISN